MTTVMDKLILQLETKLKNIEKVDAFKEKLKKANLEVNKNGRVIDATTKKFVKMSDVTKKLNKNQFDLTESLNKTMAGFEQFALGVGLSFLFTGMAIVNFFQNLLTSIFQTFLMAEGETGALNERLNGLKARLEIIKFKFADAFIDSGLLDDWINKLETLAEKFDSLDPAEKANLVDFAVKATVVGAILMVIGQLLLGLLGVFGLLKPLISVVFGNPIVLAITAMALSLIILSNKLNGFWRALGFFGLFILRIFATVIDFALSPFLQGLNLIIEGLNAAIRLSNRLFGTEYKTIDFRFNDSVLGGTFGTMVDVEAAKMKQLAEVEDMNKAANGEQSLLEILSGMGGGSGGSNVTVNVEGSILTENDLKDTIQANLDVTNGFINGSPQG